MSTETFLFDSALDLTNKTDSIVSAAFQDFEMKFGGANVELLTIESVLVEGGRIAVTLSSDTAYSNFYPSVTITLLVVRLSTLEYHFHYNFNREHLHTNPQVCTPCGTSDTFTSPDLRPETISTDQCMNWVTTIHLQFLTGSSD